MTFSKYFTRNSINRYVNHRKGTIFAVYGAKMAVVNLNDIGLLVDVLYLLLNDAGNYLK